MLTLRNITWHADPHGPAVLRDVSFTARPGELAVVIGPNGAGKSTLLKLIAGDHPVRSGSVLWGGSDLQRLPPLGTARWRAVLDQRNRIGFGFTVREVVMMGRYPHFTVRPSALDEHAVECALERMGLHRLARRDINTLSGGEQQRTHIARALAQIDGPAAAPGLLLLDEPLNDLDVKHQHALLAHLRAFAQDGHVVVAVLHDVNLAAQYAHRVLLLAKGRVLADGPAPDVLIPAALAAAYGLQAHVAMHPFLSVPFVHFAPDGLSNEPLPTVTPDHALIP
ncbi:MAG: heme ABC transporter ATP-binding protein [Bacteroidetes bacterium]|nr:heme ABC transporter ATP-binding protein [Bacteroidota bacterium]